MEGVPKALTCWEESPEAVDSEVQWRCERAVSASVCQEAVGCVFLCLNVAAGVTRPPPPGKQVQLLALTPPEPPVDLVGRLGRENKHQLKRFNQKHFSNFNEKI